MADREQPYDPYIPSGGQSAQGQNGGNQRTAALQAVSDGLFFFFSLSPRIYMRTGLGCRDRRVKETGGKPDNRGHRHMSTTSSEKRNEAGPVSTDRWKRFGWKWLLHGERSTKEQLLLPPPPANWHKAFSNPFSLSTARCCRSTSAICAPSQSPRSVGLLGESGLRENKPSAHNWTIRLLSSNKFVKLWR